MADEKKDIGKSFETRYEALQRRYKKLRDHWREHTNRRTIIAAMLLGVAIGATYVFLIKPPENFPTGELVSVPEGQTLSQIAQTLQQGGVISSALTFKIILKVLREDRSLHAGDYIFKEPLTVFAVAKRIALGTYGLEPARFRVPDGATSVQMAEIFGSVLQRFNKNNFLAKAKPMEGYLFPDTYFFLPNANENTVIEAMKQNFDEQVASITPMVASSTHPLQDIVIMASILEREARNTQDRQLIAGVLWRRIKLNMPLQADATFLYTLGKGSFDLTKADLKSDSPYNTYTHKGLPPTAIGSPSLDSIKAAANPIDKGYLYYMADNSGVTHYCKNYECQQQNVATYLGK
jgi:UPF0755 protein